MVRELKEGFERQMNNKDIEQKTLIDRMNEEFTKKLRALEAQLQEERANIEKAAGQAMSELKQ